MKYVKESDMHFGDYPDDTFFGIENSQLHQCSGEGVKTVEFVLLHKDEQFLFVEAKTSCPNAANKDESEKKEKSLKNTIRIYQRSFVTLCRCF